MSSDKVRPKNVTKTGSMPRAEIEPVLRRENERVELPEILDANNGATTGEVPAILIATDDKTQDEDSPTGR